MRAWETSKAREASVRAVHRSFASVLGSFVPNVTVVTGEEYTKLRVLGKGAFGKVRRVIVSSSVVPAIAIAQLKVTNGIRCTPCSTWPRASTASSRRCTRPISLTKWDILVALRNVHPLNLSGRNCSSSNVTGAKDLRALGRLPVRVPSVRGHAGRDEPLHAPRVLSRHSFSYALISPVMDNLRTGGELEYHLCQRHFFNEVRLQFALFHGHTISPRKYHYHSL